MAFPHVPPCTGGALSRGNWRDGESTIERVRVALFRMTVRYHLRRITRCSDDAPPNDAHDLVWSEYLTSSPGDRDFAARPRFAEGRVGGPIPDERFLSHPNYFGRVRASQEVHREQR
jgi:hypothetical protein